MSLSSLWRNVADQWDDINSHANSLARNIYDQEDWVMYSLSLAIGQLWLNLSRSVSELELKTYNALTGVQLVLIELVENIDISIESRFRKVENILNDHLHKITDYIEDAVNLVNQSAGMDYDYVDTEIYWAVYDVNQELDNISNRIDNITGITLTEVKELIEDATTELWTDTLLTVNAVKKNLLKEIDFVSDHIDSEVIILSAEIDRFVAITKAYIDNKAAEITAYVDALGGDIVHLINLKLGAAKQYIDDQIMLVTGDIDLAIDAIKTELTTQLVALEQTLDKRRDDVVDELVVVITNTELRVMGKLQTVSGRVSTLADATNWRAGFFDIFRSNPELSFLQVLLRDEAKFREFKPYWQALFARVMAED